MRVYGLPMFDRITGNYVLFVFNISRSCLVCVVPTVGNCFKRACRGGLR